MEFLVLGSSSKGNCYLLKNEKECLILECGISFKEVKKALEFNLSTVVGCLVTHEHGDHSKYVKDVIGSGIDVYMSGGTKVSLGLESHRVITVIAFNTFKVGGFTVLAFDVKHDCAEPLGYVIHHKETGSILFATDTYYVEYQFKNLAHILVECNYSIDILNQNIEDGVVIEAVKNRIIRSHFELNNVREFVKANLNKSLRNIVLLHLSDNNSNSNEFKKAIGELTFERVEIADKGLRIELSER